MSIQCEIRNLIDHYTDLVQELNRAIGMCSAKGYGCGELIAKKMVYESEMLPDLRSLLKVAEARQSSYLPDAMVQIVLKTDDGEVVYGTYPFNTPGEKNRVNELAMQIRDERGMGVEVRKV